MAGKTQYLEQALLNHTLGKTAYTMPSVWIGLLTSAPSDTTAGTEVSGGSYARKSTAGSDWTSASGNPASSSNATVLTFAPATGSWGTVTHFALYDAATAGNMLRWGAVTTPRTIASTDTASWPIGSLVVTED